MTSSAVARATNVTVVTLVGLASICWTYFTSRSDFAASASCVRPADARRSRTFAVRYRATTSHARVLGFAFTDARRPLTPVHENRFRTGYNPPMAPNERRAGPGAAVVFVVVVLSSWSRVAVAQTPETPEDEARALFATGSVAFEEARWLDCAHLFERSFMIAFRPALLYNIGLCYQRAAAALSDADAIPILERAVAAYRRYLRELPDAANAARVQTSIGDIETRLGGAATTVEDPSPPVAWPVPPPVESPVEPAPDPEPVPVAVVARNEFPITVATGALTLVSTALAIGLGVHAQSLYASLGSTCGQTSEGCPESSISEVGSFATGANVMWAVSGIALAGASIGFAVEFTATDTRPSVVALTVGRNF